MKTNKQYEQMERTNQKKQIENEENCRVNFWMNKWMNEWVNE